ncbi:hypothetical protein SAMN02745165_01735 [Malonomonas rubra DSM 5091]|uniref:Uncharacterized protein n=1 Tax=Malonomonas rubra DSM 5091 TaxID=1122189 RepID=A0A1M6H8L6_MALRU|nr:hypothetical protein [Malonomonas rubra]SHJ18598.1 hypothetical protein SAMN02745165_01735 [Malonomonas rubra DSM 5091]
MSTGTPEKYTDILRFLHGLLEGEGAEYKEPSPDQISKDLHKEGIDVSSMISDVNQMIGKKRTEKRLNAANAKRIALSRLTELRDSPDKSGVKEKLISIFRDLNSSQPQLASAYFRKLEETNEEDMFAMLEDLLLLEEDDEQE